MDNISVLKIRLPKLCCLSWHSGSSAMSREIFHRFPKFNNSVCQNMSCSITGISLLISETAVPFAPFCHADSLLCWGINIYRWERRKREAFVLLLLPMNKNEVLCKACFNTWMFSICLRCRDEPAYSGSLCEGSAMPESGRRETQRKLSEPCAVPQITIVMKISWKVWPFLFLENYYWNG